MTFDPEAFQKTRTKPTLIDAEPFEIAASPYLSAYCTNGNRFVKIPISYGKNRPSPVKIRQKKCFHPHNHLLILRRRVLSSGKEKYLIFSLGTFTEKISTRHLRIKSGKIACYVRCQRINLFSHVRFFCFCLPSLFL